MITLKGNLKLMDFLIYFHINNRHQIKHSGELIFIVLFLEIQSLILAFQLKIIIIVNRLNFKYIIT